MGQSESGQWTQGGKLTYLHYSFLNGKKNANIFPFQLVLDLQPFIQWPLEIKAALDEWWLRSVLGVLAIPASPCSHMIAIWIFGNPFSQPIAKRPRDRMITICNFPCRIPEKLKRRCQQGRSQKAPPPTYLSLAVIFRPSLSLVLHAVPVAIVNPTVRQRNFLITSHNQGQWGS